MWGDMGWGGWSLFGLIHMFLWWVLVILGIVVLSKWVFGNGPKRNTTADSALAILRERYARGEIDKQEFEARKQDLRD